MNRLIRAAAFMLASLSIACSDEPAMPQVGPAFTTAGGGDLSQVARYAAGAPDLAVHSVTAAIGPAGGSLRLLDFEVIVPANAVSTLTTFTISLPLDPLNAEYAYAEFGPHGAKFSTPLTIKLPLKGTTAEGAQNPHVIWNHGGEWVQFETTVTADGRIQTQTNHFSEYGTEENGRGITLAGKPLR
ncbi:MAG: hypothetical protein ACT443_09770 [Gemmatimonadota bacterium]